MRRVVVTGIGMLTPLGNDTASTWAGLVEGRSGIGHITCFDASMYEFPIAGEVKGFEPGLYMESKEARKMALFSQYAVAAAVQAWRDAGLPDPKTEGAPALPYDPKKVATVLGNGIGGIEVCLESHKKLLDAGPGRMLPMTVPLMIINEASGNGTAVSSCSSTSSGVTTPRP